MEQVDVLIIGSGYGGAVPAMRLAEAGLRVLVLERGPRMETTDFRQSDDLTYLQSVLDVVISTGNIAFRTGKLVGGASINMDGAHFRVPSSAFGVTDSTGRPYWPAGVDRPLLDPYYARAEAMLGVRQIEWGEISKTGGLFARMLAAVGATCDRALLNYADCMQCGYCAQGCIYGKKQHVLATYLANAEAAGAEIRAGCQVDTIEPSGTGYLATFTRAGVVEQAWGQRCVVAGGGIHSPALLLRSASLLRGLSSQIGENFNNNGEHGFVGILPEDAEGIESHACFKGMDNAGLMSFHWYEDEGFTLHPGGGLEPSIFAAALAASGSAVLPARAWGMAYKRFVESVYPRRLIAFSSLGLADGMRAVTLRGDGSPDVVDRDRTAYDAYLDRLEAVLADISDRTGVTIVPTMPRAQAGSTATHLLSACRMADTVADGVVDANNEVWGSPNLFLCDASSIPYAIAVNPALTIAALAERTADFILARG